MASAQSPIHENTTENKFPPHCLCVTLHFGNCVSTIYADTEIATRGRICICSQYKTEVWKIESSSRFQKALLRNYRKLSVGIEVMHRKRDNGAKLIENGRQTRSCNFCNFVQQTER